MCPGQGREAREEKNNKIIVRITFAANNLPDRGPI